MTRMLSAYGLTLLLVAGATAQPTAWTTDAAAAMNQARAEGKDLLLYFTGSDWCPPCVILKREVFDTPIFADAVSDRFVLVELDFPRRSSLTPATAEQNAAWADRMNIAGFPTVVLADADGLPYAYTGYVPGGAQVYVDDLERLRGRKADRDALLTEAQAAVGPERAVLLDRAVKQVGNPPPIAAFPEQVAGIIAADAGNTLGLRAEYEGYQQAQKLQAALRPLEPLLMSGDWEGAYVLVADVIATERLEGPLLQSMLTLQSQFRYQQQRFDEAKGLLDQAIAIDPESTEGQQLHRLRSKVFPR